MFSCLYEFSSALLGSSFSNQIFEAVAISQLSSWLSLVGNRVQRIQVTAVCNSPRSQSCNCYSSTGTAGVRNPSNLPWWLLIAIWSTNLCAANLSENKTVCRLDCPSVCQAAESVTPDVNLLLNGGEMMMLCRKRVAGTSEPWRPNQQLCPINTNTVVVEKNPDLYLTIKEIHKTLRLWKCLYTQH